MALTTPEEEKQHNNNNGCHMNLAISQYCTGEPQANLSAVINHYVHTLNHFNFRNLGYPTNQNFDYDALAPLLQFHLNNAGDPFVGSSFRLNSTSFEVSVLDWFANLWDIQKNKYWGYVTTGGTEANLHAILVGSVSYYYYYY
nr:serine decarboxylase 2-like [Arachis hypogaea]